MRNLKKFLALVLAMMMIFSLMVTVNAATSTANFPDSSEVKAEYKEALDVMVALGVISGEVKNGQTVLAPNDTFERSMLATMMYLLNTGDVDGTDFRLTFAGTTNHFTDVAEKSWYAKYINYAYSQGWLTGTSTNPNNPTFTPRGTVTTIEVLRAALSVVDLGGYVSAGNWVWDTIDVATKAGLTKGVSADEINSDATRQVAAQIFFNALTYVPAAKEGTVTPGASVKHYIALGKEFNTAEGALAYVQDQKGVAAGESDIKVHTTYPGSLADVTFGKLHLSEDDRDDFQRFTNAWVQGEDGRETKVIESVQDPDFPVYYGTFTGRDAKNLLRNVKLEDINIYYNGSEANPADVVFDADTNTDDDVSGLWYDDTTGINGYEIWVYKYGDGYEIIVREAYAAQVTAATKEGNPITVDVYEMGQANTDDGLQWATEKVQFTVRTTDDEELYNTLALYADKSYVGVYAKPGFDGYVDDGTVNPRDFILEIASLKDNQVVINHIQDRELKTLSTILVNDSKASYAVNNEAMWTNGDGTWCGNVVKTAARATQLGSATLWTLAGKVLVVEQTDAELLGVRYAYLIDYMAISGANAPDAWTPDWAKDTDVVLRLKILLDDGETLIDNIYYSENQDGKGTAKVFEADYDRNMTAKQVAEEFGNSLLNRIFVYDARNAYPLTMINKWYNTTGNIAANPGYGAGVTGYSSETVNMTYTPGAGAELYVDVKPGVAKGALDKGSVDTQYVVFDSKTIFFVVDSHLSAIGQKNADVKVYHGILDPDLPKLTGDGNTFVQYVLDEKTKDEDGNGGRVIAVLVSLPHHDKPADAPTTEDTYFVVGYDKATLHKRYTEAYHGDDTPYIEYYEFWAIKNGTEKVAIEANNNYAWKQIHWGSGFGTDSNKLMTPTETSFISDATTITQIKWTVLSEVINVTTADGKVTGYVITPNTMVWQYDDVKGTIDAIDPYKITENMVGYVHTDNDGRLVALYLYVPTV